MTEIRAQSVDGGTQIVMLFEAITELGNLKETQGIIDYHSKFAVISSRVTLSEDYLVSKYLAGLNTETQMNVRMFQPRTVSQCFLVAKLYESVHPEKSFTQSAVDFTSVEDQGEYDVPVSMLLVEADGDGSSPDLKVASHTLEDENEVSSISMCLTDTTLNSKSVLVVPPIVMPNVTEDGEGIVKTSPLVSATDLKMEKLPFPSSIAAVANEIDIYSELMCSVGEKKLPAKPPDWVYYDGCSSKVGTVAKVAEYVTLQEILHVIGEITTEEVIEIGILMAIISDPVRLLDVGCLDMGFKCDLSGFRPPAKPPNGGYIKSAPAVIGLADIIRDEAADKDVILRPKEPEHDFNGTASGSLERRIGDEIEEKTLVLLPGLMDFGIVEVKAGNILEESPGEGIVIQLLQVSIGVAKKGQNALVPIHVKVHDENLVITTLSADRNPHIPFDVLFERDFGLCHKGKTDSLFLCGYWTFWPTGNVTEVKGLFSASELKIDGDFLYNQQHLKNTASSGEIVDSSWWFQLCIKVAYLQVASSSDNIKSGCCSEEMKSACDIYLASIILDIEAGILLREYELEEHAYLLVAVCLPIFLTKVPSSLHNPNVVGLLYHSEARMKLAAVGHAPFALYNFLSQTAMAEDLKSNISVLLLERLHECATANWEKQLPCHQLEQSLYIFGQDKSMDSRTAGTLDPTLLYPYKYRALAMSEENNIEGAIQETSKFIEFKVTTDCLELRGCLSIASEDYANALIDTKALLTLDPNYMLFHGQMQFQCYKKICHSVDVGRTKYSGRSISLALITCEFIDEVAPTRDKHKKEILMYENGEAYVVNGAWEGLKTCIQYSFGDYHDGPDQTHPGIDKKNNSILVKAMVDRALWHLTVANSTTYHESKEVGWFSRPRPPEFKSFFLNLGVKVFEEGRFDTVYW